MDEARHTIFFERFFRDVLEQIVLPPQEIMDILPPEITDQTFMEEWAFPMQQMRKRYRNAGIETSSIDELERQRWDRIELNLDEYEERFGEPHPARVEEETGTVAPSV